MRIWKTYFLTDDKSLKDKHLDRINDVGHCHEEMPPSPENVSDFIEKGNRQMSQKIRSWLKSNIHKHTNVLSLACGDGDHEIPLINDGYILRYLISLRNASTIPNGYFRSVL